MRGVVDTALINAAAALQEHVGLDLRIGERAMTEVGGAGLRALYRDCGRIFERARILANDRAGKADQGAGR